MDVIDTIILGSGPSGFAAAFTLLKAGKKPLVITRNSFNNVCSEVTIESVEPVVDTLINDICGKTIAATASLGIFGGIYSDGQYTPTKFSGNSLRHGIHLDRGVFNAQLLSVMTNAGINIIHDTKARNIFNDNNQVTIVLDDGRRLTASYLIDCTGRKQVAGRLLQLPRQYYSPRLTVWSGIDRINIQIPTYAASFISEENGWTWLAPLENGLTGWTRVALTNHAALTPPFSIMENHKTGVRSADTRWRLFRPLYSGKILLAGDAAGVLDPAAGQGILNALWTGKIAAEAAVKMIDEPTKEQTIVQQYDTWHFKRFEMLAEQLRSYYKVRRIIFAVFLELFIT